jgi:hypothetical protein
MFDVSIRTYLTKTLIFLTLKYYFSVFRYFNIIIKKIILIYIYIYINTIQNATEMSNTYIKITYLMVLLN